MKTHRIGRMVGIALLGAGLGSASAAVYTSASAPTPVESSPFGSVSSEAARSFTFHPAAASRDPDLASREDAPSPPLTTPAALAATRPGDLQSPIFRSAVSAAPAPVATKPVAVSEPADESVSVEPAIRAMDSSQTPSSFGSDATKGNPVRMTTYKVRDMSNQVYEDLSAKLSREAYERTLLPLYSTDITTDLRFAGTTVDRDGSRRVSGLSLLGSAW
jgi:hypothetical protein